MRGAAYFGGSFDPPHIGHHEIVEFVVKAPEITKLYLVPTSQNPLKNEIPLFSNEQRKVFVQAWLEDLKKSLSENEFQKIEVCWQEIDTEGPSYTSETLARLKKRETLPFDLVLGDDALSQLEKWKDVKKLLSSLRSVWVFPREKPEINTELFPVSLRGLCPVRWVGHKVAPVSSTEIRERWLKYREFHPHQLTDSCARLVFDIIKG